MTEADDPLAAGQAAYHRWRNKLRDDPEYQAIYDQEAAKMDPWLQLADTRQAAGLTVAQAAKRLGVSRAEFARIEESGYDFCTEEQLRRYVRMLSGEPSAAVTDQGTTSLAATGRSAAS